MERISPVAPRAPVGASNAPHIELPMPPPNAARPAPDGRDPALPVAARPAAAAQPAPRQPLLGPAQGRQIAGGGLIAAGVGAAAGGLSLSTQISNGGATAVVSMAALVTVGVVTAATGSALIASSGTNRPDPRAAVDRLNETLAHIPDMHAAQEFFDAGEVPGRPHATTHQIRQAGDHLRDIAQGNASRQVMIAAASADTPTALATAMYDLVHSNALPMNESSRGGPQP
jgi:hypothetical protein